MNDGESTTATTSSTENGAESVELDGRIEVDISDALSERDKVLIVAIEA